MKTEFNLFLAIMTATAFFVFAALYFVKAGYGRFVTPRWGFSLPNKLGWILMEAPVFILMTILWLLSDRIFEPAAFCMFLLFQAHYFQRSFIFSFLLKGKNRMPLSIIAMGVVFNLLNTLMQGGWLFYISL